MRARKNSAVSCLILHVLVVPLPCSVLPPLSPVRLVGARDLPPKCCSGLSLSASSLSLPRCMGVAPGAALSGGLLLSGEGSASRVMRSTARAAGRGTCTSSCSSPRMAFGSILSATPTQATIRRPRFTRVRSANLPSAARLESCRNEHAVSCASRPAAVPQAFDDNYASGWGGRYESASHAFYLGGNWSDVQTVAEIRVYQASDVHFVHDITLAVDVSGNGTWRVIGAVDGDCTLTAAPTGPPIGSPSVAPSAAPTAWVVVAVSLALSGISCDECAFCY